MLRDGRQAREGRVRELQVLGRGECIHQRLYPRLTNFDLEILGLEKVGEAH